MGDEDDEPFKIHKNGKITLNFHRYGIPWRGSPQDLRRILDFTPIELEHYNNTNIYKYSILDTIKKVDGKQITTSPTEIILEFDELLYSNEHVSLQWIVRSVVNSTTSHLYVLKKQLKNTDGDCLFQEAILHIIVYNCLQYFNIYKAVPQLYDIVRHNGETIFTMEAFPEAINFSDYLLQNFSYMNTHCFVEILAQIALYMIPLQSILFFNHRDLKSDNILIEFSPVTHNLNFRGKKYTVRSRCRAILIDFGFGCIGFENGGSPIINSGSVLPAIDPCPKEGRDIFQILMSLYSFQAFRANLNDGLRIMFDRWLTVGKISYKEGAIHNANDPEWIYNVTSGAFFSAPGCSPSAILADIAEHYPEIVTVSTATATTVAAVL